MSIPLRACRPRLTAAQGPRIERARVLRATRYAAAARLREPASVECVLFLFWFLFWF